MNLKLFKPNYKVEKQQSHLGFNNLSKQLNNNALRQIFEIGSRRSSSLRIIIKKPITQCDAHEHKYQLNTLFKLYDSTFRNKSQDKNLQNSSEEALKRNEQASQRKSQEANSLLLTSLHFASKDHCPHSKQIPKRNRISLIKPNKSMFQMNFNIDAYQSNKGHVILPNVSLLNKSMSWKEMIKLPFMRTKANEVYKSNVNDEYAVLNRLRQNYKFYLRDLSSFEKNKWKLFQRNSGLIERNIPKHSVQWLTIMRRKGLSNYFSNDNNCNNKELPVKAV